MRVALRVFHFCSYLGFLLCEGVLRLLPMDWTFELGKASGDLGYFLFRKRREVALSNLRLAFGREKSEAQLRALNREHFQLLAANLLAGLKATTTTDAKIWERVTAELPDERVQSGWVALINHMSNWELLSYLGGIVPNYRFGAIYQGLANPYIDRHLQRTRTQAGNVLFDRRSEMLKCVRFLRDGGVVGVLIDQGAGYAGLWTPLFGRLTSSSTLAATLAVRTGVPVVPIAINTCGRARWKMVISPPLYPADDDVDRLTAQINRLLEAEIRQSPADWLWAHNRWKPLRPHFLFARDQRRVFFPPDFDRAALAPFRILTVAPTASDGIASALPAVRAIKNGRPDTWLAVLASAEVAQSWQTSVEADLVLEWSGGESARQLASKIRSAGPFDVAIFFTAAWKPAFAVWIADVPIRVGRRGGLVSRFYNQHPRDPKTDLDAVHANLQIAQTIGADIGLPNL